MSVYFSGNFDSMSVFFSVNVDSMSVYFSVIVDSMSVYFSVNVNSMSVYFSLTIIASYFPCKVTSDNDQLTCISTSKLFVSLSTGSESYCRGRQASPRHDASKGQGF